MALAVEPMVVLGSAETELLDDGWTVVSADGGFAAHYEHTIAITPAGPWVLTAEDGGEAGFAVIGETGGSFAGTAAEEAISEERLQH
jgi:methionyl aminopeptidase